MIEIKEGRYYRRRDGEVVGPLARITHPFYPFTDGGLTYTTEGAYWLSGQKYSLDLVEEVDVSVDLAGEKADETVLFVMEGRKDDGGKDPWHLLPTDGLRGIVKVLAFGAAKYAPRDWEKGMDWSRLYAGLMRHMTAWWEREPNDPETRLSHLWHAGCCILFLIVYEMRGLGKDDRPTR